MNNSSWARPGALTLVCALSLTLLTGCADGTAAKPSRPASPSASASPEVRALSQKKLDALALVDGDLPMYKVREAPTDQLFHGSWDDVQIRGNKECKPLVQVISLAPVGDAKAHVIRTAAEIPDVEPAADGGVPDLSLKDIMALDSTAVTLATYSGNDAEQAMKKVTDAVEECTRGYWGFYYTLPGEEETQILEVRDEKDAPAEGSDETIAFAVASPSVKQVGPPAVTHCQVVRHGNNVVSYMTMNMAGMLDGKPSKLDAAVVDYQSKKVTERLSRL
ncbi:hypothetical protein [Streptomyces fragilis]|uniref:Lipoprotein n=1 Tax=Streptomyces fragilis TaxID=67301 RepID=A0ABV2YJB3_9ACTN|nr:hypothetical protein [Streptomyces fragilis]